jgi:hypothetical protein
MNGARRRAYIRRGPAGGDPSDRPVGLRADGCARIPCRRKGATGLCPPRAKAVRGAASVTDAHVDDPARGDGATCAPLVATRPVFPGPGGYGLTARLQCTDRIIKIRSQETLNGQRGS